MRLLRGKILCLVLFICTHAFAFQEPKDPPNTKAKPDFSGTWILESSTVDGLALVEKALVILHHDPEMRVGRKIIANGHEQLVELVYFTDGRGETNPLFRNSDRFESVKSKTKWKGNRLVSRG